MRAAASIEGGRSSDLIWSSVCLLWSLGHWLLLLLGALNTQPLRGFQWSSPGCVVTTTWWIYDRLSPTAALLTDPQIQLKPHFAFPNFEVRMTLFLLFMVLTVETISPSVVSGSVYTNHWAVRITGGQEQADRIAAKYGYINFGQVMTPFISAVMDVLFVT